MKDKIKQAADLLAESNQTVILTGAGVSVASGIPAFRGAQGLWSKYDPFEYASIDSFRQEPEKTWEMLRELDQTIACAVPNQAHYSLAELEKLGQADLLVTQNIDGLHQAAGSCHVIEFHGCQRRLRCLDCGKSFSRNEILWDNSVPRCFCGGLIKPDIVFFGEDIPESAVRSAFTMCSLSQLMLVVGTSAQVAPASSLPILAKQSGAKIIEINLEETTLSQDTSDLVLLGQASNILPNIIKELKAKL